MHPGTRPQAESGSDAVPLLNAVLCVDCECVTNSRSEECSVCGSRSLLTLAKIIGGRRVAELDERIENSVPLDVEIVIEWKQIQARDLNDAVESINAMIGPWLGRDQASFHIKVVPAVDGSGACGAEDAKAA